VGGGWRAFWLAVAAGVTVLNTVLGLLIAGAVRDDFAGKRLLDTGVAAGDLGGERPVSGRTTRSTAARTTGRTGDR
jgi:hypothetical protein